MSVPDELRDHSFDGIQEYDNPLPGWWLGIFYITIAFSAVYLPYKHWPGADRSQDALYAEEIAAAEAKYGSRNVSWTEEELQSFYASGEWKELGPQIFQSNCSPCHREDGGGKIGPAFTDDYYIHGGRLVDLTRTIRKGVPDKGMLSWKKELHPDKIKAVACYVRSLRGKEVTDPKKPDGKKVDEAGAFITE